MQVDRDPRQIVTSLLSTHSQRAEIALRRALSANFTANEVEQIVDALIHRRNTFANREPLPPGLHRFAYHLQPYEIRHGGDAEGVIFWPEDLSAFLVDLAAAAGLNLERMAHRLGPATASPEIAVARALVMVAEVEHVYVDVPGALTSTKIPRQFFYIMAAALIGMASGDRSTVAGAVTGALSGVGALMVELLAEHYLSDPEPETDFLEDAVLRLLEARGAMSAGELRAESHIAADILRKTIKRLIQKRLIRRIATFSGGKKYLYDLAERQSAA